MNRGTPLESVEILTRPGLATSRNCEAGQRTLIGFGASASSWDCWSLRCSAFFSNTPTAAMTDLAEWSASASSLSVSGLPGFRNAMSTAMAFGFQGCETSDDPRDHTPRQRKSA